MDQVAEEEQYARLLPRVKALVFDAILYTIVIILTVMVATVLPSDLVTRIALIVLVGTLVLYEPLMVWRYGGTLGHMRMNLRVVSDRTGGNPGLLASVGRWWVKGLLGVLSFFTMAVTRRHQTLHDTASRTTMRPRDVSRIRSIDFVTARTEPVGATDVSAGRRIAIILLYELALFLVLVLVPLPFISEACYMQDRCTEGEDLFFSVLGLAWLVGAGVTLVLGWKGRLPGARSGRS